MEIIYLDKYNEVNCYNMSFSGFEERIKLIETYSYAVPNQEALDAIASIGKPVLEIGAGLGYWAYLLSAQGVDVVAYDAHPHSKKRWFDVKIGDCSVVSEYPNHVLMLCWPPYDKSMAMDCLNNYSGNHLIYIGENWGCTADDDFHKELEDSWELIKVVGIPQWDKLQDDLTIWRRE